MARHGGPVQSTLRSDNTASELLRIGFLEVLVRQTCKLAEGRVADESAQREALEKYDARAKIASNQ